MLTVLRLVGLRHLALRRARALLTIVGIAASLCLVVAITVINATLRDSIDATTRGLGGSADMEVRAGTAGFSEQRLEALRQRPAVQNAVGIIRETSLLRNSRESLRTTVFGVPTNLRELFPDGLGELQDQLDDPSFRRGLLVSERLAAAMALTQGDRVVVETPQGSAELQLVGIAAQGPITNLNGGDFALMSVGSAQRVFRKRDRVDAAYVTGDRDAPIAELRAMRDRIGQELRVVDPSSDSSAFRGTFDSIASVNEQARGVALVVALFLVLNTMSLALAERREEIVLLAIGGASRAQIVGAFVIEAAILGLLGSALGVALGVVVGDALVQRTVADYAVLPFARSGPLVVSPSVVLAAVGAGVGVAIMGAAAPALRILRVEPIDAVRPDATYDWSKARILGSRQLPILGVGAIACAVLLAVATPAGSHAPLTALAFAATILGVGLLLPTVVPALIRLLRRALGNFLGSTGRLAADSLLRNPLRTTFTVGALAFAAAVVVAVGSGLGSYQSAAERAAASWYVAPLFVSAADFSVFRSDQPMPMKIGDELARVQGVEAVYPVRYGLMSEGGHQMIIYAMPVAEPARRGHVVTAAVGTSQEEFVRTMQRGDVVLSRLTARRRDLSLGDSIALPTQDGSRDFRIGALFNDIASVDSLYLEHSTYARAMADDWADRFAVLVEPGNDEGVVGSRLRALLRRENLAATVKTRVGTREDVLGSIDGLFSLARGIQAAALFVAALIVLNTMITTTFERRREFGLQRMLGMSRMQLAASVLLEAIGIALVGVTIAIIVGLGFGYLMVLAIENQLAWRIDFAPDPGEMSTTVIVAILATAAAAVYPGWLAAKQEIAGLVRHE